MKWSHDSNNILYDTDTFEEKYVFPYVYSIQTPIHPYNCKIVRLFTKLLW